MNTPKKKYSKKHWPAFEQMSRGTPPSRAEFIAAWNEGLIDSTDKGERLMLETVYNRYVLN